MLFRAADGEADAGGEPPGETEDVRVEGHGGLRGAAWGVGLGAWRSNAKKSVRGGRGAAVVPEVEAERKSGG